MGFDVKVWPWNGPFNIDDTGWDQNEQRYCEIRDLFKISENEHQLLKIDNCTTLSKITSHIENLSDCNLIAVEIPADIIKLHDQRYGYSTASSKIDLSGFNFRGYDVCDLNGLFSVLHHPQILLNRGSSKLISGSELLDALSIVQLANFLEQKHSPFTVAKVYTLK